MKRLVSLLMMFLFVSVVPALAAVELTSSESCCAPAGGEISMMAMSCCAMPSCAMSSQPEPIRSPGHQATTSDSGQKLPAPQPVTTTISSMALPASSASFTNVVELLDPSPPPSTSERLATFSCYLI